MAANRQLANRLVDNSAYSAAVQCFFDALPRVEILTKLGPRICRDARSVTPSALLTMVPFFESLISSGCKNCVLQSTKVSYAFRLHFWKNSHDLGSWDMATAVDDTTAHVQSIATMLRHLVREEMSGEQASRSPRSGGFRKRAKSHD